MVMTQKGIPATKWPHHAQWARPAGHARKNKLQNNGAFLDAQKVTAKTPHQPHKTPRFTTTN
jgi:hypothetical protein